MNTESISAYHVHVYFHDSESRARAVELREAMNANFARLRMSPIFEEPEYNDPHQRPGYVAEFEAAHFGEVVPWVMMHQNGLNIMIHMISGDEVADHLHYAMWIGSVLPINPDPLDD